MTVFVLVRVRAHVRVYGGRIRCKTRTKDDYEDGDGDENEGFSEGIVSIGCRGTQSVGVRRIYR